MKKRTYINHSYHEANRKIWDWLMNRFRTLKSKNAILGYLWLPLAWAIYGLIVIFGWFAYLTLLFKDVRFTPHYLGTAIKYNNLSDEQAVEYLDSQKQRYLNSLAFGNISNKEKHTIDACFELLYKEYKLPQTDKQDIVINQLNDIKVVADETHSEVQYISTYTQQTELKEITQEEEREKQKQKQQKTKKIQRRINSKNPESFESSLTDEQLDLLVECCNKIKIFNKTVIKTDLYNIFLCKHVEPLQTTNGRLLSLLLANLKDAGYIHSEWQSIAAKFVCFRSSYGNDIKTSKDFSTAASASTSVKRELEDNIHEYIDEIKKLGE